MSFTARLIKIPLARKRVSLVPLCFSGSHDIPACFVNRHRWINTEIQLQESVNQLVPGFRSGFG